MPNQKVGKKEFTDIIADKMECSKAQACECLDAILEAITDELKKGNTVALTGFGAFIATKRNARTGRNPQTGEAVKISARTVVRFKVGKSLKEAVR